MTTKRVKVNLEPTITTREALEAAVGEIAELMLSRDRLSVAMESELKGVRDRYEQDITQVQSELDAGLVELRAWADANPLEFKERKSIDLVHGTIGFRTGQFQLKLASGFTWKRVLQVLKDNAMTLFIRSKEEVDREAIITERKNLSAEAMKKMGVKVVQEETFYVEAKRDTVSETAVAV